MKQKVRSVSDEKNLYLRIIDDEVSLLLVDDLVNADRLLWKEIKIKKISDFFKINLIFVAAKK